MNVIDWSRSSRLIILCWKGEYFSEISRIYIRYLQFMKEDCILLLYLIEAFCRVQSWMDLKELHSSLNNLEHASIKPHFLLEIIHSASIYRESVKGILQSLKDI